MIYEKTPPKPAPFSEFNVDKFTKPERDPGADNMELVAWRPPAYLQGRAVEVFNVRGDILGTMIFVWNFSKRCINWNQGGNQ